MLTMILLWVSKEATYQCINVLHGVPEIPRDQWPELGLICNPSGKKKVCCTVIINY